MDKSHLIALLEGLGRKREALAQAKTEAERTLRQVFVDQTLREIAQEEKFLGIPPVPDMDDDEILAELQGA